MLESAQTSLAAAAQAPPGIASGPLAPPPLRAPAQAGRAAAAQAQPVIASERFVLRPLRRSDAGLIAHWASDPRVARGTRSIPHPYPPGAAEALVTRSHAPG